MAFGKFIIMMFAVIGLIDGLILALVFRKRRFYLWSLGGGALTPVAQNFEACGRGVELSPYRPSTLEPQKID